MDEKEKREAIARIEERHRNELRQLRLNKQVTCKTKPVSISAENGFGSSSLYFEDANEEPRLFFDDESGRFFTSTIGDVLQAEYHLNREFARDGYVVLNTFYEFLGIPLIDRGEENGWSMESGIYWIDIEHKRNTNCKGETYYTIYFIFSPEKLEDM